MSVWMPTKARIPWAGVIRPTWALETKLGPLEDLQVPRAAELSFQPQDGESCFETGSQRVALGVVEPTL